MNRSVGLVGRRIRFTEGPYRGLVGIVLDSFYVPPGVVFHDVRPIGDTYDLMVEIESPIESKGQIARLSLKRNWSAMMPKVDPIEPEPTERDPGPYPSDTGTCVHCGLPMLRKDPAFPNRTRLCAVRRDSLGGSALPCKPFHEASE